MSFACAVFVAGRSRLHLAKIILMLRFRCEMRDTIDAWRQKTAKNSEIWPFLPNLEIKTQEFQGFLSVLA
jgi:hypothetical protein